MNNLKAYRRDAGYTQERAIAEIYRRAVARGDAVLPGLDQPALSKHENGRKQPCPRIEWLYCDLYNATPAQLGLRVAPPRQTRDPDDVNRRTLLVTAAGAVTEAALAGLPIPTQRLGSADVARLQRSVRSLYDLIHLHGGDGAVYTLAHSLFDRLRSLVDRASYDTATGRALRALAAETALRTGSIAFDAGRSADARRWWLESTHWAKLAESDALVVAAMAAMARQAVEQGQPRETIDLTTAARRAAGGTLTPRLSSLLLAREAIGHAGTGDARSAHAALRRAGALVDTRHDDDPYWLGYYGPASFPMVEHRIARMLGDLPAAEAAARTALSLHDHVAYPRNHALYSIDLAEILVQRREIDEAVAMATQATAVAACLDSGWVNRELQAFTRTLAPYANDPGVREFLQRQ